MDILIAGQIVMYKKHKWVKKEVDNKTYFRSQYQLKGKDILRGYFYHDNKRISLGEVEVVNGLHWNRDLLSGDLSGKFMQPISFNNYLNSLLLCDNRGSIYIMWKGAKTLVNGYLSGNMFYFYGMCGNPYKVKTYVDQEGYVKGIFTTPLTKKQKCNSYNVIEDGL